MLALKKIISKPINWFKNILIAGAGIEQQKELKASANAQVNKVTNHIKNISSNRDPWAPGAPDMTDFDQVLDHWGIQKKNLSAIIKNLCIQTLIYALAGAYGFWWFSTTPDYSKWAGIPIMLLGVLALICKTWRIQILFNKKFVFFKDWFLWGAFSWIGKETPIAQRKEKANA